MSDEFEDYERYWENGNTTEEERNLKDRKKASQENFEDE